ncbi:M14 family metallopeptidase [Paralcaligenes ginsengisoli]
MTMPPKPTHLRVHQFVGLRPGPSLLVLGAVHGNETCGTRAIQRVLDELQSGELAITRGRLSLLPVTNPMAYHRGAREGERNLNRNLRRCADPQDFEDRVADALCPLLEAHEVLLDLHSFHTAGQPFVMLGPRNNHGALEPFSLAEPEERLAAHLGPRRVLEGWMEAYEQGVRRRRHERPASSPELLDAAYGTGTVEYLRTRGGYGVTLECGQHDDPDAPAVAYQAIRQTLALLEMAPLPLAPPRKDFQILHLMDVIDRDHADDEFERAWASFDPVEQGQLIGRRHAGQEVRAPSDGFVVFPNPEALPGNEWFYFAVASDRVLRT